MIYLSNFEFDASNMFQTCWDRGNKRQGKFRYKSAVRNIPQVNRFTGNRWQHHDWVWMRLPRKGSVINKQVWGKAHHLVKHMIV